MEIAIASAPILRASIADHHLASSLIERAVKAAEDAFAALQHEGNFGDDLKKAWELATDAQRRSAIGHVVAQIALLIGIGLATAVVGAAIGAYVGAEAAVFLAEAGVAASRAQRIGAAIGTATSIGLDSAGQAEAQTKIFGGSFGEAFVENAAMSGVILAALAPIHNWANGVRKGIREAEASVGGAKNLSAARRLWNYAKNGELVLDSKVMSLEMAAQAGLGAVEHLVKSDAPHSDEEVTQIYINGVSTVISRVFAARLRGLHERLAGYGKMAAHLRDQVRKRAEFAENHSEITDPDKALALVDEYRGFLQQEAELLASPAAAQLGMTPEQIARLQRNNAKSLDVADRRMIATVALLNKRVRPVSNNDLEWAGIAADVDAAIAASGATVVSRAPSRVEVDIAGERRTLYIVAPGDLAAATSRPGGSHAEGTPVHDSATRQRERGHASAHDATVQPATHPIPDPVAVTTAPRKAPTHELGKELSARMAPVLKALHETHNPHLETLADKCASLTQQIAAATSSAEIDDLVAQAVECMNQCNEVIWAKYVAVRDAYFKRRAANPHEAEPAELRALTDAYRRNAAATRELAMRAFASDPYVAHAADGTQQMSGERQRERADIARSADLQVEVDAKDPSAHATRIANGKEEIDIAQPRRTGRIADPEAPADDAALARVGRAAERIARENVARVQQATAAASSLPYLEVGHLQEGYGPQGAMNLGVQTPAVGEMKTYDRVVIASLDKPSVMFTRGDLEIGQPAYPLDHPGLPARATTRAQDTGYMTSKQLADAKELGQAQIQATVLDGELVGRVQSKTDVAATDWQAPSKSARVRVKFGNNREMWVYFQASEFEYITGAGQGRDEPVRAITAADTFDAGQADGTIVDAADLKLPAYVATLRPNAHVVALGGSASNDWAAELCVPRGVHVTVVGDVRAETRAAWGQKIASARASGGESAAAAKRAEMEKAAHPGLGIPRNQKPGAAGDHPDIALTTGTWTAITRLGDGRYRIEQRDIATGEAKAAEVADMIVFGFGQSKAADFVARFGPAPADGMFEPIFYNEELVGLRDPKTGTTVRGAAAVNRDIEPWVKSSERDQWKKAARKTPPPGTDMYSGKKFTRDSAGVQDGMEMAADRIHRGAVLDALDNYRLPKGVELEIGKPGDELAAVRKFIIDQVPAAPVDKVALKPLTDGKTGDLVYEVTIDGKPLGVVKLFHYGAGNEKLALKVLSDLDLQSMRVPRDRGVMDVAREGVPQSGQQAQLTDFMDGQSIRDIAKEVVGTTGRERATAIAHVTAAEVRAAEGLAEIHVKTTNTEIDAAGKRAGRASDADYLLSKIDPANPGSAAKVAKLGGAHNAKLILEKARVWAEQFKARTDQPAAAYLGDAHISNFKVSDYDSVDNTYKKAATFDTEKHRYGYANGKPTGAQPMGDKPAAAADLARLVGSLETKLPQGTFDPVELGDIKRAVIKGYIDAYNEELGARAAHDPSFDAEHYKIDQDALQADMTWYQFELEIAALDNDPGALTRIETLMGIVLDVTTVRR